MVRAPAELDNAVFPALIALVSIVGLVRAAPASGASLEAAYSGRTEEGPAIPANGLVEP